MKKELQIPSTNETILKGFIYEPDTEAKGIVLICHGMAEHIQRYNKFMQFLCDNNYIVFGYDQRGHGQTAGSVENCGYMDDTDNIQALVYDLHIVIEYIKKDHENLPIYLFGHSMGSFISQRFVELYDKEINGLILSGSTFNEGLFINAGHALASIITKFKGRKHISKLINNLSLGSYNKAFKPNETSVDWLSRDKENNIKYEQDEYCGMIFSVSYFKDLTKSFKLIANDLELISNDLPIYIMSGDNDPVGNFGKGTTKLYNKLKCDIIGHFDLITKYNADGSLFDAKHPRYIAAWQAAADAIIKTPAVVEINTGGIARGHVSEPYPSKEIIEYFKSHGKKMIFSSDCHNKDYLLCGYDTVKKYL